MAIFDTIQDASTSVFALRFRAHTGRNISMVSFDVCDRVARVISHDGLRWEVRPSDDVPSEIDVTLLLTERERIDA